MIPSMQTGWPSATRSIDENSIPDASMDRVAEGQPVCMLGIMIHILVAGATFNLHTRKASAGALVGTR